MRVASERLILGDRITESLFLHTDIPIVEAGKKLGADELRRIKRFLIKEVDIEERPEGMNEDPLTDVEVSDMTENSPFDQLIDTYNHVFTSWEQGLVPNVYDALRWVKESMPETVRREDILPYFLERGTEAYTVRHAIYRGAIAQLLAEEVGKERKMLHDLWVASYFADCGLARIMEWRHTKRYEAMQQEIFHRHPAMAFQALQKESIISDTVKRLIVQHHERLDGSGYPLKVKGDKIMDHTRLFIVADVFAAMTSWRPYREAYSVYDAYCHLKARPMQYDSKYVTLLGQLLLPFEVGDRVLISNGKIATILRKNPVFDRPVISYEEHNQRVVKDLMEERQLNIIQLMD
ncbi:phosphohydrolase [Exiguobacterium sp. KRL4]|uniref:HD-GYP domain-containing protein n=1 Tax=Exiguobacterium sp. KRL4 TaxID=1914536 RepID=UPI0008F7FCE0|nr:HD domain-containing phosphohydrolase [Exiguobacterium sp. KRL4]OIN67696.1 phosphohydrolase [Exiguobacterium sp. KRL4]